MLLPSLVWWSQGRFSQAVIIVFLQVGHPLGKWAFAVQQAERAPCWWHAAGQHGSLWQRGSCPAHGDKLDPTGGGALAAPALICSETMCLLLAKERVLSRPWDMLLRVAPLASSPWFL